MQSGMARSWPVRPREALAALSVVAALTVSGCGSSDGASASSDNSGSTTSSSYYSPLESYLNPSSGSTPEDYAAKEKQVQELVATCMTDQGFEYVPFVYPVDNGMKFGSDEQLQGRAWTEKYGYGISTFNDPIVAPSSQVVDPNQAIVEAMTESERTAYYAAMYGDQSGISYASKGGSETFAAEGSLAAEVVSTSADAGSEPTEAAASEVPADVSGSETGDGAATSVPEPSMGDKGDYTMPPLAEQGCWGQAQAEVYGDQMYNGGDQSEFQDLWDAFSRMYETLQKDPKVASATTAWVECMSGAGHPGYKEVYDANNEANNKWSELNGWPTMDFDGMGNGSMSAETAPASPTTPAEADVATFREYEIALALTDYDCKVSSRYEDVMNEVRIAAEEQFINDHRDELERYRDSMNTGGG